MQVPVWDLLSLLLSSLSSSLYSLVLATQAVSWVEFRVLFVQGCRPGKSHMPLDISA